MPIYAYKCDKCGKEFEKLEKMTSLRKPNCPVCDSAQVTLQVSAGSFQFKGSGFYDTDYRKKGAKP